MNAKAIVLCILFVTFGFIAKAEDSHSQKTTDTEIPGGIVYSDGKDAIYYDFETKESKNLTADLKEAVVKSPFAISENGKTLIWLQDSKFYLRELPIGAADPVQVDRVAYDKTHGPNKKTSTGRKNVKEDIIWEGGDIKNMSLSPDGSGFGFDTIYQEPGWVFSGNNIYGESGTLAGTYPFYAKTIDSFNGIFYLSTTYNGANLISSSYVDTSLMRPELFRPRYGNIIENPPGNYYTASSQDLPFPPNASANNYPIRIDFGGNNRGLENGEQIYNNRTVKKSAHYLAFRDLQSWQGNKRFAAFIFQIGNQWGPIEIRLLDSKLKRIIFRPEIYQNIASYGVPTAQLPKECKNPTQWEILLSLNSCEGLFWKPDGSLTLLSGGYLYSINATEIQEGMDKSDTVVSYNRHSKSSEIYPTNNVFQVKPKLVDQKVNSVCIHWITNDAFLFLDRDMMVYLWDRGKIAKALYSPISSEFYYCSRSPLGNDSSVPLKTALK